MPTILIIAGPNGAGKTTFANQYFAENNLTWPYLNADEIGRDEFPALAGGERDMAAGRRLLHRMDALGKGRRDFAFETTLSSQLYARRIPDWRGQGYAVCLHYIGLASAEASIARVALRVSRGGHGIPEADLRRRFGRSVANLEVYKLLVDEWRVWESSESGVTLVARSNP